MLLSREKTSSRIPPNQRPRRRWCLKLGEAPFDVRFWRSCQPFSPSFDKSLLTFGRWFWESDTPLRFQDSWFQAMLDSPDLRSTQTLKLELETLDYKVVQLMPIVERLKRMESREYETHIVDGQAMTTKFVLHGEPEVYTWTGPANLDGGEYLPYRGKTSLDYHVLTLTWRLRFPSMPRAHIPTLRRAPRIAATPPSVRETRQYDDPIRSGPRMPGGDSAEAPRHLSRAALRRQRRGESTYGSKAEENSHKYRLARGVREYLLAVQRWQGECWLVGEGNRFRALTARWQRERWEARWRKEGCLLEFE